MHANMSIKMTAYLALLPLYYEIERVSGSKELCSGKYSSVAKILHFLFQVKYKTN